MTHGVVAHGAGSCAATARRLLPAEILGWTSAIYLEDRTGDIRAIETAFDAAVRGAPPGTSVVVAGISLGAHAAARWSATRHEASVAGLIVVMPAWTGDPDDVAGLTVASGADISARGTVAHLADSAHPDNLPADLGWVVEELHAGWSEYDDATLAACLHRAGHSRGPTAAQLSHIAVPTIVVGLRDDPLHPLSVSQEWAEHIPQARLEVVDRAAVQADRAALARAAMRHVA